MTHEAFDGKIRAGRRRIGLACADLARAELAQYEDQSSHVDTVASRDEIALAKTVVEEWVDRRDNEVYTTWERVRREWEGGVREVIRGDGSGEALERCRFVMERKDVSDADCVDDEGGWTVRVWWDSL